MMTVSDRPQPSQSKKLVRWLMTVALWLTTVGLGFLAFIAFQDLVTTGVAFFILGNPEIGIVESRGWITSARNFSTIIGGMLWLAVMVGGMEYHFRNMGERRSMRAFAWTLGIEVALIIASALLV